MSCKKKLSLFFFSPPKWDMPLVTRWRWDTQTYHAVAVRRLRPVKWKRPWRRPCCRKWRGSSCSSSLLLPRLAVAAQDYQEPAAAAAEGGAHSRRRITCRTCFDFGRDPIDPPPPLSQWQQAVFVHSLAQEKKMVQDEELSRADSSSSPWLSVVALFSAYRRCLGVHPQLPRGLKVFFST